MVLLPTAFPGILTGVMLAVARAAGETAPLLFTALFSNYWLWSHGHREPDAAHGLAGRADLQLCRHALSEPGGDGLGRGPGAGAHGADHQSDRAEPLAAVKFSNLRSNTYVMAQLESTSAQPKSPACVTAACARRDVVIDCHIKELYYGSFKAVRDTAIPVKKNTITAFIGPSGCGKSTVLRCLNRMNDLVRGFRFEGHVHFRGKDIYHPAIDPVAVRRFIGMVFQQPNPFATSIFNNVAFGLRLNNYKGDKARKGRTGPEARRPLGRGQRQAAQERPVALRRPAAAACASPAPSPPSPKCC